MIDVVFQDKSESRLFFLEIFNCLVDILHGILLNPRLDVVFSSKIQHILHFLSGTSSRTRDGDLTGKHGERVDLREPPRRPTDIHELTIDT